MDHPAGQQLAMAAHCMKPKKILRKSERRDAIDPPAGLYEAEVLNGLRPVVMRELVAVMNGQVKIFDTQREDQLTFSTFRIDLLPQLRTVVAVFRLINFKIQTPTRISEPRHFERLLKAINAIQRRQTFRSFRFSAAGSDSPFFKHLAQELQRRTKLKFDSELGEMVLRFRRSLVDSFGWDVLIRLTPRPLSARPWRKANIPGALNGTLAAAMVLLSNPTEHDNVCNAMCGTGTLLVERHFWGKYRCLWGFDISSKMLTAAHENLSALKISAELIEQDATYGLSQYGPFDVILADLPYGRLIGRKENLAQLYNSFLHAAWAAAAPGARLVVISQEVKLLDSAIKRHKTRWRVVERMRVKQSDFLPVIISCSKVERS